MIESSSGSVGIKSTRTSAVSLLLDEAPTGAGAWGTGVRDGAGPMAKLAGEAARPNGSEIGLL